MSQAYRELVDEDKAYISEQFKESQRNRKQRSDSYREEVKKELKLDTFQGHRVTGSTRSPWGHGFPLPITPAGSDHESLRKEEDEEIEVEKMEVEICGPEYTDITKTASVRGQPIIHIAKEAQMQWSHEMARRSRNYRNGTFGKLCCKKSFLQLIV